MFERIALVFAPLVCLVAVLWMWRSRRRTIAAAARMRAGFAAFSEPLLWARWWARNACEEQDPAKREILLRCAAHALLVDGGDSMRDSMRRSLGNYPWEDPGRSPPGATVEQIMVAAALREASAAEKAWVRWAREEPGKPQHVPYLVERGARQLLGQLDGSPQFAPAADPTPKNTIIS